MSTDLVALLVLFLLVLIAVAAPRFGADTRASREWSEEHPQPWTGRHP